MTVKKIFVLLYVILSILGMFLTFLGGVIVGKHRENKKWSDFLNRAYEKGEYRPSEARGQEKEGQSF